MKKLYVLLFLLSLLIYSCGDDAVFKEKSAERVQARMDECDETLRSREHGWKMVYVPYPGETGGFNVLMKFYLENGERRVLIQGDITSEQTTSSYSLNASQGPVLNFDTYSALHLLAKPVENRPYGLYGEQEFMVYEVTNDSIVFKGKKNNFRVVFYPATATDWEMLPTTRNHLAKLKPQSNQPFFRGLSVRAGAVTDGLLFIYDSVTRLAEITWANKETRTTESTVVAVYGTSSGVSFIPAINLNGIKITSLVYNGVSFSPNIADGLTGELAYRDEAPFPFYDSFNELLENANGCAIPMLGSLQGDFLNLILPLTYGSYFSPSLNTSVAMPMIMQGLRQFTLSMRSPIQTTGRDGMWLNYFGARSGMGEGTDYYLEAIEPTWVGEDGDKVKLQRIHTDPNDLDSPYVTYETSIEFRRRLLSGQGSQFATDMRLFFTSPDGFTVVPSANGRYYFISLANSMDWVLLVRN